MQPMFAQSALNAQGMVPLMKNNFWLYNYFYDFSAWSCTDEIVTIDSFQYNVLIVNYISPPQHVRLSEDGYYVLRRDSTYNEPNHEEIYYKKNAQLGESWTQLMFGSNSVTYTSIVTDTFNLNIFDTLVVGKVVRKDLGLVLLDELWTEEFGLISTTDFYVVMEYLVGCVIDGVVYGDTSTTSVDSESLLILPNKVELLQNYPNPFNPATTIKYDIVKAQDVKLVVYDILGREVATLVNAQQQPGSYEVSWDASNFASGIYFYTLTSGNFTATKKLILLK